MKPEMQSENTSVQPKSSLSRRLAKMLAPKHKHCTAAEAHHDSQNETEFLACLLDKSSQPFFLLYPDERVSMLNEAYAKLVGYSKEELYEIPWKRFTPPEWHEKTQAAIDDLRRTGQPVQYEKEYIRKDGSRIFVEVFVHIIKDKEGRPEYYYAFASDITERKIAEDKIKYAQKRYCNLFKEAPVMYVITRIRDGVPVIADCNALFLSSLGYTISEVLEHPLADFYTPDSRAELLEGGGYQRALSNRFINEDRRLVTKDGRIIETLLRAVPETGADGFVTGTRAMYIDVTAQKQAERQLQVLMLRQETLLSAIPDIIMEVDVNKVYAWANEAGKEFFGADVIGKEASLYFSGEQNTYNLVKPLFNGNDDIIYLESRQKRKDGEIRLLAWWCRTLKDEQGKVKGALSTARDITEQRRTETQLSGKMEELERWNQAVMGREMRVIELKREVNELLAKDGLPPRYTDGESMSLT